MNHGREGAGLPAGASTSSFVYLASQSPRRQALLAQIGVRFEMLVADADEDAEALEATRAGELPLAYVERVTWAKLAAAQERLARRELEPAPIVCADTTVTIDRRILGKPADAADAARMLGLLAGRTHRVITAVVVAVPGATTGAVDARSARMSTSVSLVRFAAIDAATIARYIAGGEPFGKAGAYAIQSAAAAWIERIEGSYTGIMGLPLHETAVLLREAGVDLGP